ncbi:sulfotransferase domain-containing protein [Granulosicoccus sp. 3-233]|uniref:sulfotransferase domain-containing protein n=1 Tax=Granulosicoccus sp. 3-233 TaxID=3417969 RepID=UPI003D33979E
MNKLYSVKRFRSRVSSIALRNYLSKEANRVDSMVVCGYPKSGTTWVTQLVSHICGLAYSQNDVKFCTSGVVLHTHAMHFKGKAGLLYVVRDPREVVCSAARALSGKVGFAVYDAKGNVTADFVDYCMIRLPGARMDMASCMNLAKKNGWVVVRFEDLKNDAVRYIEGALADMGMIYSSELVVEACEKYDFMRLKREVSDSVFLAQSTTQSWKTHLTREGIEKIRSHCGEISSSYGYEI